MKVRYRLLAFCAVFLFGMSAANALTPKEKLGKFLFFDENLSEPAGMACASCHDPDFGFVDPDDYLPVSEGVIPGLWGGRNSPSVSYAMFNPVFHFDVTENRWVGGVFWDGRASGEQLGDPLADQALGPFLNPIQMANTNKAQVVADVANSDYATLFENVWGDGSLLNVESAYDQIALSVAAFERTRRFGRFSSKYDTYLRACLNLGGQPDACAQGTDVNSEEAGGIFSRKEWRGLQLFMGWNDNDGILDEGEGAACSVCHIAEWTETGLPVTRPHWAPENLVPPLFTNFTFENLGIPKSEHPVLMDNPVDLGLGPIVWDSDEDGKFRVMGLRDIRKTRPYGHNGYFTELPDFVHFINTRDVGPWAEPEFPDTVNTDKVGNLGLSSEDEDAVVKFMMTLTDRSRGNNSPQTTQW